MVLLVLLSPLLLAVAVAVKATSPGPALFRQHRPGRNARDFTIFKFRTMLDGAESAELALAARSDPQVTGLGRHMRKWKLDELPQLLNVLRGEMSFVGPRPLPKGQWDAPAMRALVQRELIQEAASVQSVRPGITSLATLSFRNEEELLAALSPADVETAYLRVITPLKLRIESDYLRRASFAGDVRILLKTAIRVFRRGNEDGDVRMKEMLSKTN